MHLEESDDFFAQLASWRPELVKRAVALTGNLADAEDLVQSAFERALKRRRAFRPNTCLRAWLNTVTRNLAIDQLRQRWRTRNAGDDLTELPAPVLEPPPWWVNVSDEQVHQALVQCSAALREAFRLRHYEGLSLAAIATKTGTPIGTVATRIFRARARVRSTLEAQAPLEAAA